MNAAIETPTTSSTVFRRPEDVNFRPTFGGGLEFYLTGANTNGWLTGGLYTSPPDNGPPVHIHNNEDELLIVIEGRFSFFADGKWSEGGPGTAAFLPRGKPHAFKNVGTTEGRLFVLANPSGLESFFPKCEEPFHRAEGPDFETIIGIGKEHGIEFV